MLCEKCKIKKATVFYTELDRTRHSLCNSCAVLVKGNLKEYLGTMEGDDKKYSPTSYLYELAHNESPTYFCKEDIDSSLYCSECKISVGDVLRRGYLNCPNCYVAFSGCQQMNCYGDAEYQREAAQMPQRYSQRLLHEERIRNLRTNLRAAVEREDFELAATLRDEIRRMDT